MDRTTHRILELAHSVLDELNLDLVLDRVLEAAQELTEARYAALGVLNSSKSELSCLLTRGIDEQTRAAIGVQPRGRGVLGALIEEPKPLRLANISEHPLSYAFPRGHPPMKTFLGVPILIRDNPYGNLYLTEKAGGRPFSEEDEQAVVKLAEFAALAIDHARRYTGASERAGELERTVATLEATTQIMMAVDGETDPAIVLEVVAKRGRALVRARALVIEIVQGEELVIVAGAGELPERMIGGRMVAADTLAATAMLTRRSERLSGQLGTAGFLEHGLGRFGFQASTGLIVPLVFRGEAYGALLAFDRLQDGPLFTPEDEHLLEAFASSAATAVATARSVAAERQRQRLAAAEGERRRWARELHDGTLQSLSALRISLSAATRSQQPASVAEAVTEAVEQIDETIADLRALITDLRPASLDELGVHVAIEALAERARRHGIAVEVHVELAYEQGRESTRLAADLETAIYRIVQEALSNATKHSNAGHAVVELRESAGAVHLSVSDDGGGFDPQTPTRGFGLLGMQERVALLDGELTIDSTPGGETVVHAIFPVRRGVLSGERRTASPEPVTTDR